MFLVNYRVLQGLDLMFYFYTDLLWFNTASVKTIKNGKKCWNVNLVKNLTALKLQKQNVKFALNIINKINRSLLIFLLIGRDDK